MGWILILFCWSHNILMMLKFPCWHFKWEWNSRLNYFQQAQCQMLKKYFYLLWVLLCTNMCDFAFSMKRTSTRKEWLLGFDYTSYSPLLPFLFLLFFSFFNKKVHADLQPHLQVCFPVWLMKCSAVRKQQERAENSVRECRRLREWSVRKYGPCGRWNPNPGSQKEKCRQIKKVGGWDLLSAREG